MAHRIDRSFPAFCEGPESTHLHVPRMLYYSVGALYDVMGGLVGMDVYLDNNRLHKVLCILRRTVRLDMLIVGLCAWTVWP